MAWNVVRKICGLIILGNLFSCSAYSDTTFSNSTEISKDTEASNEEILSFFEKKDSILKKHGRYTYCAEGRCIPAFSEAVVHFNAFYEFSAGKPKKRRTIPEWYINRLKHLGSTFYFAQTLQPGIKKYLPFVRIRKGGGSYSTADKIVIDPNDIRLLLDSELERTFGGVGEFAKSYPLLQAGQNDGREFSSLGSALNSSSYFKLMSLDIAFIGGITFLLGHEAAHIELGHHKLGRPKNCEQFQALEAAADARGKKIIGTSNLVETNKKLKYGNSQEVAMMAGFQGMFFNIFRDGGFAQLPHEAAVNGIHVSGKSCSHTTKENRIKVLNKPIFDALGALSLVSGLLQ